MKVHWMSNTLDCSTEGIRQFSEELNDLGYYSVLLTYDSKDPDRLIQAAHVLNKNHKIKYMIAIRPYSISPEYCVMLSKGFNAIQNNRLMLNIVQGHFTKGENKFENTVLIKDRLDSREKVIKYTEEWIKKYLQISNYENRPKLGISGHSKEMFQIANKYGDYHLVAYNSFTQLISKKNIICAPVVITNKKDYVENMLSNNNQILKNVIYGSEQEVFDKFMEIKNKYSDFQVEFMLWGLEKDRENFYKIHKVSQMLMEIG